MNFEKGLCVVIIGSISLALGLIVYQEYIKTPPTLVSVEHIEYGKVVEIKDCYASKHQLECAVRTEKVWFNQIDVTNLPHKYLNIGDTMMLEVSKWSNGDEHQRLCVNNLCTRW